ncbi:26299_t:CDS:1, partial [Gigaspora rosea]
DGRNEHYTNINHSNPSYISYFEKLLSEFNPSDLATHFSSFK